MARDLLPMVRQALSGRYEVDREIGRGGAARVFAARASDGRLVALKVLHPQLAASVAAERFFREIHHLAPLEHPHIARLIDYGEEDWVLYYVMDYVEGPTLKQHLQAVRRAGISDTLRIAHDVLDALACAHDRGIVHRDVKPENILLAPQGAVLVDFGIARAVSQAGADRLTRSGFAVGTSAYMSPEQIAGSDDIDARSDIYSLGCVLFECPGWTTALRGSASRMPCCGSTGPLRFHRFWNAGKTRRRHSRRPFTARWRKILRTGGPAPR